ncbi:hypothetical protein [Streptomyces sp. NPDC096142]|uniref:hypothetical protein n=1 Tax=Streptomyces sp. NPDC096142 TaxID=3366077 RepID=UPI003827E087
MPYVAEAAPRQARFNREAEREYVVGAATALVLDRGRASRQGAVGSGDGTR